MKFVFPICLTNVTLYQMLQSFVLSWYVIYCDFYVQGGRTEAEIRPSDEECSDGTQVSPL